MENLNTLSGEEIKKRLNGEIDISFFNTIDSTNNEAKRLINAGKKGSFLVAADSQTSGRGRQGKSFYSPAKTGIYMSLVLRFERSAKELLTLTSAAAVAVCRAIEELTDKTPEIKWVNDVFIGGKKVCGILCEAVELNGETAVIIGIGINISTSKFPKDVELGGSLGCEVNRAELVSAIANKLIDLAYSKPEGFIDYYRSRSMLIGKSITFTQNNKETVAAVTGIDNSFALMVVTQSGEQLTLTSGEITVRKR